MLPARPSCEPSTAPTWVTPRPRGRGRAGRHPPLRLHASRLPRLALGGHRRPRPAAEGVTVDEIVLLPGDEAIAGTRVGALTRSGSSPATSAPATSCPTDDGRPPARAGLLRRRHPATRSSTRTRARSGRRARPGPCPGAVARGPRAGRRALVRRQPRPRHPAGPVGAGTLRVPAASWSGSPARWHRCSACARTPRPTTTAGWSRWTTAAAPTPRPSWPRRPAQPLPSPCSTRSCRGDELEKF